jgi:hypothetical protein
LLNGFTFSTEGEASVDLADKQKKSNIIEFSIVFFDALIDLLSKNYFHAQPELQAFALLLDGGQDW